MIGGIILAKGTSVRLPRKNLQMLAGRPLLTYILEAVTSSIHVHAVWVSTEDPEIAEVATQWGAQVLMRPVALAADTVSDVEVLDHVLQQIPEVDTVVMASVTRPLLATEDVNACITLFEERHPLGVLAMTEIPANAWFMSATVAADQAVSWHNSMIGLRKTSSELLNAHKRVYRPAGIWVVSREAFFQYGSVYVPDMLAYIVPKERGIDINDEHDLAMAEAILTRQRGWVEDNADAS